MRANLIVLVGSFAAVAMASASAMTTTSYTYDTLGRLSTVTYANDKQIVYTYDQAGNRTQVVTQTTTPHGAPLKVKPAKKRAKRR